VLRKHLFLVVLTALLTNVGTSVAFAAGEDGGAPEVLEGPSDANEIAVTETDCSRATDAGVAFAMGEDGGTPAVPEEPSAPNETTVTEADRSRAMAGTWGDPVAPVGNLPGVVPSKSADDGIVVWGARAGDSRVLVDGLEVPALMHLGGLRSAVGVNAPARVELVPGAYGAEYGRALGGLVLITTRDLPTQGVHGAAETNLLDSSLALAGAPTSRFRVGLSGTWSYAAPYEDWLDQKASTFYGTPSYRDFQAKAEVDITPQKRVAILALGAWEHLHPQDSYRTSKAYPSRSRTWSRIALRYSDDARNGTLVMPFVGWTRDDLDLDPAIGFFQHARSFHYGARAWHDWWVSEQAVLTAALDSLFSHAHSSLLTDLEFPVRGDDAPVSLGSDNVERYLPATWRSNSTVGDVGASLSLRWSVGHWTLVPGLRTDLFVIRTDKYDRFYGTELQLVQSEGYNHYPWVVQPRLSVAYDPRPWLGVDAAAGLYSQAPDPVDLSPMIGNPRLGPSRAGHASLGLRWRLGTWLAADATGFFRRSWDLPWNNQPSPNPSWMVTQDGKGRAWGGQLMVRQTSLRDLDAWIGYTFTHSDMRTTSSSSGEIGNAWWPASRDRTHTLVGVLAYRACGWVPGMRARYATGTPYTPVESTVLDSSGIRYWPITGAPNSARFPAFFHLDLHLGYEWTIAGTTASLSLDVNNVTAHHNGESFVYNYDYTKSRTLDAPLRTYYFIGRWQF
jgi:hypothetical protein